MYKFLKILYLMCKIYVVLVLILYSGFVLFIGIYLILCFFPPATQCGLGGANPPPPAHTMGRGPRQRFLLTSARDSPSFSLCLPREEGFFKRFCLILVTA